MTIARMIENRAQTVVSCSEDTSVEQAARMLAENRIGAMPVFRAGAIAGIFSERDLLRGVAQEGAAALGRRVGDVMATPPITVAPQTGVMEALGLMTRRRIRHLPVVENGQTLAFISIGDLVKQRIEEVEHEAEAMREYIRMS